MKKKDNQHFLWGNEFLTDREASTHFLALGAAGSGKTINILLLMKSVVARMKIEGSGVRSLVYDSKTDLLSKIRGTGIEKEDILVLNPFDDRRCAWDMAKDITTPGEAEDLASLLAPANQESNPYFSIAAQKLLSGMIKSFQVRGCLWTLRDLILASRDPERIKKIVEKSKYTRDLLTYFENEEILQKVCSMLATKLGKFESVASSWEGAKRKFTIGEWMKNQQMLVLGNDSKQAQPIQALNQLLFASIAKEIMTKPGEAMSKHWFFLDGLRELGFLRMLNDLMLVGRSKGAAMVLGVQDTRGLAAEYGDDKLKEIIGQARNLALLRINPTQPETQKWASKVAGQLRYREIKTSMIDQMRTDPCFHPLYFSQKLHKVTFEKGMAGLFYTREKLYEQEYSGKILFTDEGKPPRYNRVPDAVKGYDDHQPLTGQLLLEPWNDSDLERLGI
ncbi:MAG: hypothetical protein ACJAVK_000372 [Akkermansiaceae bacterium]|jgi:hypothetical protein